MISYILDSVLRFLLCTTILMFFIALASCSDYPSVTSVHETPEVDTKGDAADDPAIWTNLDSPNNSLIFGTDKRAGVYVYDLKGSKVGYTALGEINNIDLRIIESETYIVGSNRTDQTIDLWIVKNEDLKDGASDKNFSLNQSPSISESTDVNVYGICAGFDKEFGLIFFATEDEGPSIEMWNYRNGSMQRLLTFDNGGESEGCVYDDEHRTLFISEEETNGVLKAYDLTAYPDLSNYKVVDSREGNIGGDPEGVALYKTSSVAGYIILSSQGDSKFNLYRRQAPYQYIGSFMITDSDRLFREYVDGVSETDGIDAVNFSFNSTFDSGLLVVQDDKNDCDNCDEKRQNFKYIDFKDVEQVLNLTTF